MAGAPGIFQNGGSILRAGKINLPPTFIIYEVKCAKSLEAYESIPGK